MTAKDRVHHVHLTTPKLEAESQTASVHMTRSRTRLLTHFARAKQHTFRTGRRFLRNQALITSTGASSKLPRYEVCAAVPNSPLRSAHAPIFTDCLAFNLKHQFWLYDFWVKQDRINMNEID